MNNELSRVVDALPGPVWTALPDTHINFLNQHWGECIGLPAEAIRSDRPQTRVLPEAHHG